MAVDLVYRIEQPHRPGMLARICARVAESGGLIGDISTIALGRERSIHGTAVAVVGQVGLGAAGFGIASLAVDAGARAVVAFDPDERSHDRARARGIEIASFEEVLARADVLVATTARPGLISADQVRPGSVVPALTNPDPEITPDAALAAGAAFAADGSSVNNVLGFPGIFRGAEVARVVSEAAVAEGLARPDRAPAELRR